MRGLVYLELGKLDEAIADCGKGIELDPQLVGALFCRGVGYQRKGLKTQANGDLEAALELAPDATSKAQVQQLLDELEQ